MSTSYFFNVVVGFELDLEQIWQKYQKKVAEKSHKERRFNPKTGKRAKPVKVVDRPAGICLRIRGRVIDVDPQSGAADSPDLHDALSNELGAIVNFVRDSPYGSDSSHSIVVTPPEFEPCISACFRPDIELGHITGSGAFFLEDLVRHAPAFDKLRESLRKKGFTVGKPVVRLTATWG